MIARMDVVLTTRLHGTVLAIKNGVPAIVVDPVSGGDKVSRQARSIGWPFLFSSNGAAPEALIRTLDQCLAPAARELARACARTADELLNMRLA